MGAYDTFVTGSLGGPYLRASGELIKFCPGNSIDSHIIPIVSSHPPAKDGPLPEKCILYLLGLDKSPALVPKNSENLVSI
jgi:hypothetical protein